MSTDLIPTETDVTAQQINEIHAMVSEIHAMIAQAAPAVAILSEEVKAKGLAGLMGAMMSSMRSR